MCACVCVRACVRACVDVYFCSVLLNDLLRIVHTIQFSAKEEEGWPKGNAGI